MRDFLVIGGGIAGISAAARLSALGSVTLIEAEDAFGYHTSGRSAALFAASYGNDAVRALNAASRDYLAHANGGVLSPRGFLMLAGAGEMEAFEAEAEGMQRLTPDEAQAMVPIVRTEAVAAAAYSDDALDIDTDRLMQDFLRTARANGAEALTGVPATAIRRTARGWAVATPKGEVEASTLVNAAGAWADRVAKMAGIAPIGLQPYRRSVARTPPPGGHDVSRWPMLFGAGESWYAKNDAGAWIISGAEEDPMEPHDAWADDMVLAEGIARYQVFVTEEVTRVEHTWAGLRSFAPDRSLVLGPDPADPAFVWSAGQGGYGFQTAPAASQLVADLVGGCAPELDAAIVAALSPARFRN